MSTLESWGTSREYQGLWLLLRNWKLWPDWTCLPDRPVPGRWWLPTAWVCVGGGEQGGLCFSTIQHQATALPPAAPLSLGPPRFLLNHLPPEAMRGGWKVIGRGGMGEEFWGEWGRRAVFGSRWAWDAAAGERGSRWKAFQGPPPAPLQSRARRGRVHLLPRGMLLKTFIL